MKKKKIKYTLEVKKKAVEDFISGKKTAEQLAQELEYNDSNRIYKWKSIFEENKKQERVEKFKKEGISPKLARKIQDLEVENDELKKALGEKSLLVDLLKKLHPSLQYEKNVNGLPEIMKKLAQKKKPVN